MKYIFNGLLHHLRRRSRLHRLQQEDLQRREGSVSSMEQWLVISNCQTHGLASCLQAQVDDVLVTGLDYHQFNSDPQRFNSEMGNYSKLFIAGGVKSELASARMDAIAEHIILPMPSFRAYHPDTLYLLHEGRAVTGAVSDYHSTIAYACFQKGISVADAIRRYFTGSFFERCGYMSLWLPERDHLVADFAAFGLDLGMAFRTWGRQGAFMYSIYHPRIHVFHDMAAELLRAQGRTPLENGFMPPDNLANGACFAVYPEIGEALGIAGGYVFKNGGSYRPIGLEEFITGCFESYGRYTPGSIEPHPAFRKQLDYIGSLI